MSATENQIKIIKFLQDSLRRYNSKSKGFLTLEEARNYSAVRQRIITHCVSLNGKYYWWFSDNHMYGYCGQGKELIGVVPCSSYLPMRCVSRPSLPSGQILTVDDYITVFHSDEDEIHINDFSELIKFIDENNLYSGE